MLFLGGNSDQIRARHPLNHLDLNPTLHSTAQAAQPRAEMPQRLLHLPVHHRNHTCDRSLQGLGHLVSVQMKIQLPAMVHHTVVVRHGLHAHNRRLQLIANLHLSHRHHVHVGPAGCYRVREHLSRVHRRHHPHFHRAVRLLHLYTVPDVQHVRLPQILQESVHLPCRKRGPCITAGPLLRLHPVELKEARLHQPHLIGGEPHPCLHRFQICQ
mmetsp:Transcript_71383/g.190261  ORF Transcript_71383/g.190261 Transcript_71383/m.190261 type:complete len:213 (-) Transcript_71383:1410-2048(-)